MLIAQRRLPGALGDLEYEDPRRRDHPAGDHQLHRSLAVRSSSLGRISTCTRAFATIRTTTYDTTGLNLRMSHPFAEYWRWHTGYRISRDIISHLSDFRRPPDLVAQKGATITSSIGASLTRDSRDVIGAPTKGCAKTTLAFDFAGLEATPSSTRRPSSRPTSNRSGSATSWDAGEAGYEAGWGARRYRCSSAFTWAARTRSAPSNSAAFPRSTRPDSSRAGRRRSSATSSTWSRCRSA